MPSVWELESAVLVGFNALMKGPGLLCQSAVWRALLFWLALSGPLLPQRLNAAALETHQISLPAARAFEEGQGAHGVKLDDSGAIVLYDRVLIEDDGPGAGSDADWLKTDRAETTRIAGDTWVKKILHLERLGARAAWLTAPAGLGLQINGHTLDNPSGAEAVKVSPSLLKEGDNEVILSNPGAKVRTIQIASPEDILRNAPERKDWPRRSFISTNGGKSWQPIRGEYMVRLHLIQYVEKGDVTSPVIELSEESKDGAPLLTPVVVRSVALKEEIDEPSGSTLKLSFRVGSSPVFDAASWSDWLSAGSPCPAGSRYLQWKADLATTDPLATPSLRGVTVAAAVEKRAAPDWAKNLRPAAFHNEVIRYTSMPFEYEDPLHPRMVALRQKYKLDEIVAGATSETEKLVRLRDWVAHQWKICAPEDHYPAWDADEILTRKYGFCVQFACTMMQCAISLGYQARFVFGNNPGAFDGGGHEVCEIWSNEHDKWMFFDVNENWHLVNPATLEPMSMLQVHDLIRRTYYDNGKAAPENAPRHRQRSGDLAICYGTNMLPSLPPQEFERHFSDGLYSAPTRWLFVNYLPRNNFYEKPYPQPKTQGVDWNYSDYWRWEDPTTPKQWMYRNFTARRSDLNWTINQVRFDATIADQPGTIQIQMGTVTPYFDSFLVNTNGHEWNPSPRSFAWNLRPGPNRLEMRVRNTSGVLGPISFLEVGM